MKKKILLTGVLTGIAALSAAQTEPTDTVVIEHPDRVIITTTPNEMNVHVEGREGDPAYDYMQAHSTNPNDVNVTRERISPDFDFKLPFQKSSVEEGTTDGQAKDAIWVEIFANLWCGALFTMNEPSNLDFKTSLDYGFNILNLSIFPSHSHWSFSVGIQYEQRNYRTNHHCLLLMDGSKMVTSPYPTSAGKRHSSVKIGSFGIPLLANYRLYKELSVFGGAVFNFNTHGKLDVEYKFNGHKLSENDHDIYQRNFTIDFMAGMQLGNSLGLYLRYAPMNVLPKSHGPAFNSFSTGLILYL